ncbi:uncharacterized protein DFL_005972 [Arthrobotrys flagrans]|uniref:CCHC-type domain-containing protein n=1 Tax=Arthrobotrys flagrans TaxID=97331 RepID=A0A436ZZ11_ARTFL|nr:hypothetical protein DFL_005972 [Arthrobotrys flagrans]
MDSPTNQEHIVSLIRGMKVELDSKTADIAEIKDNLALLKSFILGAATNQAGANKPTEHDTRAKDASEKNLRSSEGSSKSKKLSDTENSIEKVGSMSLSIDNNHLLHGLYTPVSGGDDEITRPRSTGELSITSSHWQMQPQTEAGSDNEFKPPAHHQRQQQQLFSHPDPVGQQPTTKISINGVPRAIPSTTKGSAPFNKPSIPIQPGGLAPPYMMHNRAFGPSVPQNFRSWQGGPQPQQPFAVGSSNLQVPTIGQWQSRRSPGAFGPTTFPPAFGLSAQRHNSRAPGMHPFFKPRMKSCTYCGGPTHFYKQCPQKLADFKGGRLDKQPGPNGGNKYNKPFNSHKGVHPPDRLDKSPSYPIDRQLELIDYMVALNRADDIRKAAQAAVQPGPPCT